MGLGDTIHVAEAEYCLGDHAHIPTPVTDRKDEEKLVLKSLTALLGVCYSATCCFLVGDMDEVKAPCNLLLSELFSYNKSILAYLLFPLRIRFKF